MCKYDEILGYTYYWVPKIKNATLLANANSLYVAAELGYKGEYSGPVRARTPYPPDGSC